jgi:hypothetical protein
MGKGKAAKSLERQRYGAWLAPIHLRNLVVKWATAPSGKRLTNRVHIAQSFVAVSYIGITINLAAQVQYF